MLHELLLELFSHDELELLLERLLGMLLFFHDELVTPHELEMLRELLLVSHDELELPHELLLGLDHILVEVL
jgi:hypothetical protein